MSSIVRTSSAWVKYNNRVLNFKEDTNPLGLPPYTMRFQFDKPDYGPNPGNPDIGHPGITYVGTWTRVSSSPNIWDFTYSNTNWGRGTNIENIDVFEYQKSMSWWMYYSPSRNKLTWSGYADIVPWVHLLGANTSGITNMSHLFDQPANGSGPCVGFADICLFDTSSVTNLEGAFSGLKYIQKLPMYDTHSATTLRSAFAALLQVTHPVMFDLASCTNAQHIFVASSIPSVKLVNTDKVTDFSDAFFECTNLTSVNLFDTRATVNMNGMFCSCSSITSVPKYDTRNVTDMGDMFNGCTNLTTIPLFNTSKVTDFSDMAKDCTSISSVPLFDTSMAERMSRMFSGCRAVTGGALALYQQASTQPNVPQYHSGAFSNCGANTTTGQTELAQIPSDWGGTMQE